MSNDQNLLAELRRHNLLITLLERQIIAEAVGKEQPSSEDLETTRLKFLQANGLKDAEALDSFLNKQGLSEEDFNWQLALPLRIKQHCLSQFRHKAEARFLARKNQLDRVVYSLLRTTDMFLAQELYLRIYGGEANFGNLASQFSEGPERETQGIIGPVSMASAHPIIVDALRTSKPGFLLRPLKVGEWWVVMRLESVTAATFDEGMSEKLCHELFNDWVKEELSSKIANYSMLGVEPTAE